jgi:hypothetical protein
LSHSAFPRNVSYKEFQHNEMEELMRELQERSKGK